MISAALTGRPTHFTQPMQTEYNPQFVPQGCDKSTTFNAITTGVRIRSSLTFLRISMISNWILTLPYSFRSPQTGSSWEQLYDFADAHNVTIVGGYHQTIAAGGGWLMVRLRPSAHVGCYAHWLTLSLYFPFCILGRWPQRPLAGLRTRCRPRAGDSNRHTRRASPDGK